MDLSEQVSYFTQAEHTEKNVALMFLSNIC